ncbi:hypothetical protein ABIA22_000236 [Sinorhizobium fredii]
MRTQQDGRKRRRQGQRIDGGDYRRDRDRHGELQVELASDPRNEGGRHEDGGQDERDGNDRRADFIHGYMRRLPRRHALRQIALDILDDDDRIVDHDADRQHQPEEGQHVEGEAEGEEQRECADQRHRNGDDRNDRGAPGLEENDDHQRDEDHRLGDRHVDLVDRFRDEFGRVVDDPVFEPLGKVPGKVGHRRLDRIRRRERIGAGAREDAKRDGWAAVQVTVCHIFARAELDARDVLQLDEPAILGGLDDHIAKLPGVTEAAVGGDGVLKGAVARHRRTADRAAGDLDVLLAQRLDDIAGRHAVGGEFLRVEPDTKRILALAEQDDVADAVETDEQVANAGARVIGDIELVVAVVRRQQVNDHHQVGRALGRGDPDAPDILRQARLGNRDAVLHEHLRLVEVRAELEGDRQRHRTVGGRVRGHVEHVLDAVDFLFERGRNRIGDGLRIRSRIGGPDDDGGRCDFRILRHRQLEIGDAADDQEDDRQNRSKDRPIDEEMRKPHWALSADWAASCGRTTSSGFTLTPGRARMIPLTMIVSSPVRPLRMTR